MIITTSTYTIKLIVFTLNSYITLQSNNMIVISLSTELQKMIMKINHGHTWCDVEIGIYFMTEKWLHDIDNSLNAW